MGGMRRDLVEQTVITRMIDRFAAKTNIALYTQNAQLAKSIYDDAVELPLTTTCRVLSSEYDIIVDGCVYGDNMHLQICFMDGKPSVLKNVTRNEYERANALLDAEVKHPHLVELRPISLEKKLFVVMPLLPITVVSLSGMPEPKARQLWDQVASGLDHLHDRGFAHKDVKPDNICVDSNGKLILIDMGDTVKFGQRSGSTSLFIPSDLDGDAPATALLDWGMLMMTVYDRMQPQGEGVSFRQQELTTSDLLSWFQRKSTDLYEKMLAKVGAGEKLPRYDAHVLSFYYYYYYSLNIFPLQ